ncbi:MAG TPA: hypothetical protein VFS44_11040 [Gemmatimonadaceae bacterium]|nr:hypothetical protein [Gemmatimonadaceae bacterium]
MPPSPLAELRGWLVSFILLALFLVWYVRRWHRQRRRFWAPLAPIIDGRAHGGQMTGRYEGRGVIARAGPTSDSPRSPNNAQAYFAIAMDTVAGRDARRIRRGVGEPAGNDWEVRYGYERASDALHGTESWHVATENDRLRDGLARLGLIDELQRWGTYPTVAYDARSRMIGITEDYLERMTPERFQSRLQLLTRLSRVNQELE